MRTIILRDNSGELYVVDTRVDDPNVAIYACGPLYYADIDGAIHNGYDSDPELAQWITDNWDRFTLVDSLANHWN